MLPGTIFKFVMDLEGGATLVNDPRDPGGLTRWGICQRDHPSVDVANLTEAQARSIYQSRYWDACRCDELPAGLALIVFDCAVNQGVSAASRLLQRAAGVAVDGQVGPVTLSAVQRHRERDLIEAFALGRIDRYFKTANADRFLLGWVRRAVRVTAQAMALATGG